MLKVFNIFKKKCLKIKEMIKQKGCFKLYCSNLKTIIKLKVLKVKDHRGLRGTWVDEMALIWHLLHFYFNLTKKIRIRRVCGGGGFQLE